MIAASGIAIERQLSALTHLALVLRYHRANEQRA